MLDKASDPQPKDLSFDPRQARGSQEATAAACDVSTWEADIHKLSGPKTSKVTQALDSEKDPISITKQRTAQQNIQVPLQADIHTYASMYTLYTAHTLTHTCKHTFRIHTFTPTYASIYSLCMNAHARAHTHTRTEISFVSLQLSTLVHLRPP